MKFSISAAGIAEAMKSPCIASQALWSRNSNTSGVSMPSAHTVSDRLCARSMIARTIVAAGLAVAISEITVPSIFTSLNGIL